VKYFAGSLWGVHEANNKVNRIDPTSGTTLASITGTVGSLYGLGVSGGYVFACGERGVMQIDPATNTVTKTYIFRDLYGGHQIPMHVEPAASS